MLSSGVAFVADMACGGSSKRRASACALGDLSQADAWPVLPLLLLTLNSAACSYAQSDCACLYLQASAVIGRVRRALAAASDAVSQRIGLIATALGRAFGVDDW